MHDLGAGGHAGRNVASSQFDRVRHERILGQQAELFMRLLQRASAVAILGEAQPMAASQFAVLPGLISEHLGEGHVARLVLGLKHRQRDADVDTAFGHAVLAAHDLVAGLIHLLKGHFVVLTLVAVPGGVHARPWRARRANG